MTSLMDRWKYDPEKMLWCSCHKNSGGNNDVGITAGRQRKCRKPGPAAILSNIDNLTIGGSDLSRYFKGSIDEVRIWNRALSPEEIKASYDAGIYRLYSNFTNLANGKYSYRAYAQNSQGNVKQTKKRTLKIAQ